MTSLPDARLDKVLDAVYEAATGAAGWQSALRAVANCVQADAGQLIAWSNAAGGLVTNVYTDDAHAAVADSYNSYYVQIDPRRDRSMALRAGEVMACHQHFDERFVKGSEFYQDFLIPAGFRWLAGGSVVRDQQTDTMIALLRLRGRDEFPSADLASLRTLLPHFRRAMAVRVRICGAAMERDMARDALQQSGSALLITSPAGRLMWANRRAEALLRAQSSLRVVEGVVQGVGLYAGGRWRSALESLAAGLPSQSVCLDSMPSPDSWFATFVRRGPAAARSEVLGALDGQRRCVLVVLNRPGRERAPTAYQMVQWFDLSPAQARLAVALLQGRSVDQHAADCGLKMSTVRTHVRGLLMRTGCDTLQDFLRTMSQLPAHRDAGRPDRDSDLSAVQTVCSRSSSAGERQPEPRPVTRL